MNSKEAQKLVRQVFKKRNEAVCIQQEVWRFKSGNEETEYVLWVEDSPLGDRRCFSTWKELVSYVKENY